LKYVHIEVWRYWGIEMLRRWGLARGSPFSKSRTSLLGVWGDCTCRADSIA
jgi:hypothetical protein